MTFQNHRFSSLSSFFLLLLFSIGISTDLTAEPIDWARFKEIKLKMRKGIEVPTITGESEKKPLIQEPRTIIRREKTAGNLEPVPPKNVSPPIAHRKFAVVYTRIPRTHGQHIVKLKDGSNYTLESPDIWDTLPDVSRKYSGFNAPGQLVYLLPDGTEKILYDCFLIKQPCVPLDPMVSFDGEKIIFSVYRASKFGRGWWNSVTLPNKILAGKSDAQLHIIDIASGKIKRLAHTLGVHDVSPVWLPDGRIMFASDRKKSFRPWLHMIKPTKINGPQLYIADADGHNAKSITPHEVVSALHPYVLKSGRIAYSSHWMSHNLAYIKNNGSINWPTTIDNMWMVTDIDREGGDMTALLGAHRPSITDAGRRTKTMKALHFLGQRANNDICVDNYYRSNNLGLGDVFCFSPEAKGVEGRLPGFIPRNIYSVANWSRSNDEPSRMIGGIFQGKIGYPEGIEDNQLMLTVGRGYCTQVSGTIDRFQKAVAGQPGKLGCDTGIYQTTQIPSRSMNDIVKITDQPEWHEFGARMVRARSVEMPALIKSGDGSCLLTSSDAGVAEAKPHFPYKFNNNYKTSANHGGEIDGLPHSEMTAIRFWEVVPNKSKQAFKNSIGNKLNLLGDVALLADKSFVVELPCDTPYIMAGIDKLGRVIKRDQIPQSLRPGEKRVCTGCHLHSRAGRPYEQSMAFNAPPVKLTRPKPLPAFEKDIKPILKRRCSSCHSTDVPILDYNKLVWDFLQKFVPDERKILLSSATNANKRYGLQRPYTSKYVNNMFARESLLYWKASNKRSDGRTDSSYDNDIDYGTDHPTQMTTEELRILAAWLDGGAPK